MCGVALTGYCSHPSSTNMLLQLLTTTLHYGSGGGSSSTLRRENTAVLCQYFEYLIFIPRQKSRHELNRSILPVLMMISDRGPTTITTSCGTPHLRSYRLVCQENVPAKLVHTHMNRLSFRIRYRYKLRYPRYVCALQKKGFRGINWRVPPNFCTPCSSCGQPLRPLSPPLSLARATSQHSKRATAETRGEGKRYARR